jgi:hypothetical protein
MGTEERHERSGLVPSYKHLDVRVAEEATDVSCRSIRQWMLASVQLRDSYLQRKSYHTY